jgi:hypothetical protein
MTTHRELDEILAEIGSGHRAIDAPKSLEPLLFAAAASRKGAIEKPRLRFAWALAAVMALLALVATAGVLWQTQRSHPSRLPQTQQARSLPAAQFSPQPTFSSARVMGRPSAQSKPASVRGAGRDHASHRDSSPKQATWNSLDEFVPLPVSEGLAPSAELSVVRVRLRGSDLQQYGLQAPADGVAQSMLAEFVVGEDGLPRAIRIVR